MTSELPAPSRRETAERAALWLLTLQSEELSAAQREELIDWLRESPQHISELLRILTLQRGLARFKGWHKMEPVGAPDASSVVTWLELPAGAARPRPSRRRLHAPTLIAAAVAGLVLIGGWLFTRLDRVVLSTQLAERRATTLADGSVVELAPDSEVVVLYHDHERLITLKHGEALFHVAKSPERPFIVQAAETRVRAVGTVFNVQSGDQGVSVTVVEGRVAVSQQKLRPPSGATPEAPMVPLMLNADEQVSISPSGRATTVRQVRSGAVASWTNGQLVFENETIGEIARRFNLYNRIQIRVIDASLAARRISGVFKADDPESFVALVEAVADAHVVHREVDVIMLGVPTKSGSGVRLR